MSEATRSRQIALKAVSLVNSGVAIQAALDGVLAAGGLSPRDRHFCSDLVYGYFRNKIRLDFILDKFLKNPSKTSRIARSILGLGLYSLLFQDSTPAWAAIDEAVKLAKKKLDVGGAKVVNGVLRNISRSLDDIREPEWHEKNSPDKWSGLAVFYSIPPGLAVLWRRVYGEEAALNLMRVSSARPWTGIRLNSASPLFAALKKDLDGLVAAGLGRNLGDGGYAFAKAPAPLLE
ncbi:MAG: hypothetical protein K2H64_00695, partial [Desulfovibrio sp.]|nr:hypothetical protein [Desulfovibrio sp.]